jgi:hypothetical protein
MWKVFIILFYLFTISCLYSRNYLLFSIKIHLFLCFISVEIAPLAMVKDFSILH